MLLGDSIVERLTGGSLNFGKSPCFGAAGCPCGHRARAYPPCGCHYRGLANNSMTSPRSHGQPSLTEDSRRCGPPPPPPPPPLLLGIAGDATQHLLWRLEHGELAPLQQLRRLLVVLVVGTNNLGVYHHTPDATADGVVAVARLLLERTHARVLVSALLPRGATDETETELAARCSPPAANDTAGSFIARVAAVNSRLRIALPKLLVAAPAREPARTAGGAAAAARASSMHARLCFADCADAFMDGGRVNASRMPDLLHPNAEGYGALWRCLGPRAAACGLGEDAGELISRQQHGAPSAAACT